MKTINKLICTIILLLPFCLEAQSYQRIWYESFQCEVDGTTSAQPFCFDEGSGQGLAEPGEWIMGGTMEVEGSSFIPGSSNMAQTRLDTGIFSAAFFTTGYDTLQLKLYLESAQTSANDFIDVYFRVDPGPWYHIVDWDSVGTTHTLVDDFGGRTIDIPGIPGADIFRIYVLCKTNTFNEKYWMDNVEVRGFMAPICTGPPNCLTNDINVILDASGQASITPGQIDNGSTGAGPECDIVSRFVFPNQFSCADLGPNTVTLFLTDESGNNSDCDAVVTVIDNMDPICQTQDVTVFLDNTGHASVTATQVDDGSTDNCAIVERTVSPSSFDCFQAGDDWMVTLTVKDASGNSSSCPAQVTVLDDFNPFCSVLDTTLIPDETGLITVPNLLHTIIDNCPQVQGFPSYTTLFHPIPGDTTYFITAVDASGNQFVCESTITVACRDHYQLNNTTQGDMYIAKESITFSGTIPSGDTVTFVAPDSIIFDPGAQVDGGVSTVSEDQCPN